MAISWPFDSTVSLDTEGNPVYSRTYSANVLARILQKYFRNGVFSDVSTNLQVLQADGMTVTVKAGDALINGRHFYEEADRVLAVQAASASLNRIDSVVLRLNLAVDALAADLYVVTGAPAAAPVAPTLTRNSSVYELGLANLLIVSNSTTISQAKITDTRLDSARCGVVATVIGDTDTSAYYQQIQADLATFKSTEQAAFEAWFDAAKSTLGEDSAGELLNLIHQHAPQNYSALLAAGSWSTAAPYSQTVTVEGLLATDTPIADLVLSDTLATAKAQLEAYAYVSRIDTAENALTVLCYDDKPTVALELALKVVR